MSDRIRDNQVKSINSIQQDEHQDSADAKRVTLVDELGNPIHTVTDDEGNIRLATDAQVIVENASINADLDALNPLDANPDNALIVGSEDGSKTGVRRAFVNNVRLQILAAHDRDQLIVYADFGTKNQRITQIDYTSPTFPGITARKSILYSLVGNRYRRDNITWSIV